MYINTGNSFRMVIVLSITAFLCTACEAGNSLKERHVTAAHSRTPWFTPCQNSEGIYFKSGFDAVMETRASSDGQQVTFEGESGMKPCEISASRRLSKDFSFGRSELQFQGGNEVERWARVVPAPDNPSNRVLAFMIKHPNVREADKNPSKGRVQMNVYKNDGIKRVKMSVRLYLDADFNIVKSFPDGIKWLTLSEWWNNAGWTKESFPFRISVNLIKEQAGINSPFLLSAHAQTLNTRTKKWSNLIWEETNRSFVMPIERWVTLEYDYQEGNASTGYFKLTATVDGGESAQVFNVRNYTHHPDDPKPDGLRDFNPLKLYTSQKLINYVNSKGGAIKVYWDDLDIQAYAN